jgi:hypothetical protein
MPEVPTKEVIIFSFERLARGAFLFLKVERSVRLTLDRYAILAKRVGGRNPIFSHSLYQYSDFVKGCAGL